MTTIAARTVAALAITLGVGLLAAPDAVGAPVTDPKPLVRAHAHNDYEHTRPLRDALDNGFTSVEADVWLVDGKLLVGHELADLKPRRTLARLYLDPLVKRVKSRDGRVYRKLRAPFQLLIEEKSESHATYLAIDAELRKYRKILTRFRNGTIDRRAVTAVITGGADRATIESQSTRFAGYDGGLADLDSGVSPAEMPLVSADWMSVFTWYGYGPMPAEQRTELRDLADRAHLGGYRLRFWNTPDLAGSSRRAVWKELLAADVDLINSDDLVGLRRFLLKNDV